MNGPLIDEVFARQAKSHPDKIAVQFEDQHLTYRELDDSANALSRRLIQNGVTANALVALCFERSIEMIVAMLGVLKAGGAYLPLDPAYPAERLAFILDDAKPTMVLVQPKLQNQMPETHAVAITLDDDNSMNASVANSGPTAPLRRPDDLAYVIYTSGSTGKPKGVMVDHHNVVRLLTATHDWFNFGTADVWTMFHSYAFDFSVWEVWGCLLSGGRLVVVPQIVTRSPQDFHDLLVREQITVLNQTPTAFYQLMRADEDAAGHALFLRYVIFGGEALSFAKLRPWFLKHEDRSPQLVNMFGITETTVHVSYRPVTAEDAMNETRSLIGAAIPDLDLHVLDDQQQPTAIGIPGEICVGGAGVSKGYLNRPDLTAERFIPDQFRGGTAKIYRSGDMACRLDNGDIEYLGRRDNQVKIRGFRIELGEIEATLAEHPDLQDCTVIADSEQRLICYFAAKSNSNLGAAEVQQFLRERLPSHMVPQGYMQVDAMPLTINGKLDRNALPKPTFGDISAPFDNTTSSLERAIADIWCDVLKIGRFGLGENFFDLGGDSVSLAKVHSGLRSELSADIPITDLFEFTTVRSLAGHLSNRISGRLESSTLQQQARRQRAAFQRYRDCHLGEGYQ